ncbi:MAG: ABC transporter permease [Planctomycetes bacterium]|nr:ABC transporter permease [Planctomycetota bacterium]
MKNLLRVALPPIFTALALLLAWEVAVRVFHPAAYLLPSPFMILNAACGESHQLMRATLSTAASAGLGFLIAAILGMAFASLLGQSRFLQRGLYPLASLFQMVPLVAIAPLLVIWLGYGLKATMASAAIVAVFPVLANTLDGLRSTDPALQELFSIYHARRFTRWWKLELPSAAPGIFTGLRIAAGLAVIGTVVGEFVSGYAGEDAPLGMVVLAAMRSARTDLVFAAVALSAMVGFLLFGIVSLIGWLSLRKWHASTLSR